MEQTLIFKNLPITETIIFFNQLGRMQSFCKKYNLTIKDIQNNEELQERIKHIFIHLTIEGYDSVENISDDDEPLPNPDD